MTFELRDHTADVAVAAEGRNLEAVFASVADGLAAAMCDEIPEEADDANGDGSDMGGDSADRFSFSVVAESRDALLYDYLADLIYERDVRAVLPVGNEVEIHEPGQIESRRNDSGRNGSGDGESGAAGSGADRPAIGRWRLDASARGVPLSAIDAREVKAVTYSEMVVAETSTGWRAYVVFDV